MTAVTPGAVARERTPYSVAARELLRDTLLDGARDLVMESSWAEVTMNDIATAAGVSRQTLYSEFGSRAEFAQAFVLRESEMFLAAVEAAVNAHLDDPTAALSAALDVFMTAAEEHPLIRAVVTGDGTADGLLPFLTTQGKPVVQMASDRLAAVMVAGWPQVSEHDAVLLADCLVRLAISYAALPSASKGVTAKSVTTVLGPYIEQVVGDAS
jgi:AcrR family transcriptional regulator